MRHPNWHIIRDAYGLTLARHMPPRFDVAAETLLPAGHALRYAHQIRQDLWRALQSVRGFSPVVRMMPVESGWRVKAGGRAAKPFMGMTERIEAILSAPRLRDRWTANARKKQGSGL